MIESALARAGVPDGYDTRCESYCPVLGDMRIVSVFDTDTGDASTAALSHVVGYESGGRWSESVYL